MSDTDTAPLSPEAEAYELTPDEATGFDGEGAPPEGIGFFNRKKVMIVLSIAFSAVVGGGLLLNTFTGARTPKDASGQDRAARPPAEFLQNQLSRANRALENRRDGMPPEGLPDVTVDDTPASPPGSADTLMRPVPVNNVPPPPASGGGGGGTPAPQADPLLAAYASPLIPRIEGSLFAGTTAAPPAQPGAGGEYLRQALEAARISGQYPAAAADPYRAQNARDDKQAFYGGAGGGNSGGYFIGGNALWIGTVIPGILVTAVNTDLPGEIIARVTQHVYDSRTGSSLLIPQGSLLVARYNSSVSYAQHRVQIVWDTLIRPDGFFLDLGGMNGVDKKGMAGQEAVYHENWFEYLKAAGIITMFSVANSRMTEEAAKYTDESTAAGVARSNAEFVNQMGSNIVARAMNVQPALTVDSGTLINIMLNKNLFLPPAPAPPVPGTYTLE
jgi:type IV secretory pathway VirB10-like protein